MGEREAIADGCDLAILSQAHEELRSCVKHAMSALQAFGNTEEGVTEAYTTLRLGLSQTESDVARATLEERASRTSAQIADLEEALKHVASRANAALAKAREQQS